MSNRITEKDLATFVEEVYIERCDKETDELLAVEPKSFLEQGIIYFQNHLDEFIYVESGLFESIGVDAISLEMDSVFRKFDVMLGLKKPKKTEKQIREFLTSHLKNSSDEFVLMFNGTDGIWELNFSLNGLKDFDEAWTIHQAFHAINHFLLQLVQGITSDKGK